MHPRLSVTRLISDLSVCLFIYSHFSHISLDYPTVLHPASLSTRLQVNTRLRLPALHPFNPSTPPAYTSLHQSTLLSPPPLIDVTHPFYKRYPCSPPALRQSSPDNPQSQPPDFTEASLPCCIYAERSCIPCLHSHPSVCLFVASNERPFQICSSSCSNSACVLGIFGRENVPLCRQECVM